MGKYTFDQFRDRFGNSMYRVNSHVRSDGWAYFCGHDRRGYAVMIQRAADDDEVKVRVGCRFLGLRSAKSHWSSKRHYNKRAAKEILRLIEAGLKHLQSQRYISRQVKFSAK